MQVAKKREFEIQESADHSLGHGLSSVQKVSISPNTLSIPSSLPPLGTQQQHFAFGEGSRMFAESTQQDRSLQKWCWIFAGLAFASLGTMGIAIWQFSIGI